MKEYTVYIIRCSDGSYYTGITNDIEQRMKEHNDGQNHSCYTFTRRPVHLVYAAHFREVLDAIAWEKKVKRWTRKKKEILITRDYEQLPGLAKRRTPYKKKTILCHGEEPQRGVSNHGTQ